MYSFWLKSENVLITTRQKRDSSFSQKFFWSKSSSELVESSFDKFAKRNFQKSRKVSLEVRIYVKTKKFVKNLFLHFVFRTRRKKFWQPICWSLADSQKKFRPKFGSQTRNFFGKNFFFLPSLLPEHVESSLWQLYGKFFLPKVGKIFARSSSTYQKHWKIQNNRFPQLVFWTSRN